MDIVRENDGAFLAEVRGFLREANLLPEAQRAQRAQGLLEEDRATNLEQVYRARLEALVRLTKPVRKGRSGVPVECLIVSFRPRVAGAAFPALANLEEELAPHVPVSPQTPWSMRNPLWNGGHDSAIHGLAEVGMTHRPSSDGWPRRGSRGR